MTNLDKSTKAIASLSLFSEMRNQNMEIKEVVVRLVIGSARRRGLTEITPTETLKWLFEDYGFEIPNSVILSLCKSSDLIDVASKKPLKFVIKEAPGKPLHDLNDQYATLQRDAERIIEQLHEYVRKCTGTSPSAEQRGAIEKSFFTLLLEDDYRDAHTPIVSRFIIHSNSIDPKFGPLCNAIAEGLIIYLGLSHEFPDAVETFKTPLTLLLDTEMLYNIAGFNGPVYKKLAEEFYQTVNSINTSVYPIRKKNIISLRFLQDTESEINDMFEYVERLKRKNSIPNRLTNVTNHLMHSCQDAASVAIERGNFFHNLAQLGIKPLTDTNFTVDPNFEIVNIDTTQESENDGEYIKEEEYDYGLDVVTLTDIDDIEDRDYDYMIRRLRRLNDINQLRKSKYTDSQVEKAGYVLITGTFKVLEKSKELVKDRKIFKGYPLAKSLAGITCALWFKSNNTLNVGKAPMNINAVLKSRLALSFINSGSVKKKYDFTVQRYKRKEISQEELLHNLAAVMTLPFTPERINSDDDYLPSMEDVDGELKKAAEEKERQQQLHNAEIERRTAMIKAFVDKQNEIYQSQYDDNDMGWQREFKSWENKKKRKKIIWGILWIVLIFMVIYFYATEKQHSAIGIVVQISCAIATIWSLAGGPVRYFCSSKYRESQHKKWEQEYTTNHPLPKLKTYTESDLLRDHPEFK